MIPTPTAGAIFATCPGDDRWYSFRASIVQDEFAKLNLNGSAGGGPPDPGAGRECLMALPGMTARRC